MILFLVITTSFYLLISEYYSFDLVILELQDEPNINSSDLLVYYSSPIKLLIKQSPCLGDLN